MHHVIYSTKACVWTWGVLTMLKNALLSFSLAQVMRHEIYSTKADVWSWGVLLVEALSLQVG